MGFDRAWIDISCDVCGLESEPEELSFSPANGGGYSLDEARRALRNDGWVVEEGDRLVCIDCKYEVPDGSAEGVAPVIASEDSREGQ